MANGAVPGRVAQIRAGFAKRFPSLSYHALVLRRMGTIEMTHRVASWVGVLVIFGVGLALLFNQELFKLADAAAKGFDPRLPLVLWFLFFAAAFMRSNYAEIEKREAEIEQQTQRIISMQQDYMIDPFRKKNIEELINATGIGPMWGIDRLVSKIDLGQGTDAELATEFDTWKTQTEFSIRLVDEAELAVFREAIDTSLATTPREALRIRLAVLKKRIELIHIRQKMRYDSKVAERKKKEKEAREARARDAR